MSGPILSSSRGAAFRPLLCWPLLPTPDENGRLHFPDLETSIRQRIEAVLRTSPGEQLMRPDFGAGLESLIHHPNTAEVRARVRETVAQALGAWEPRILVDRIAVTQGDAPDALSIMVAYRVRATGAAGQITARAPVGGA